MITEKAKEAPKYIIPKEAFNEAYLPYLNSNARTEIFYGGGGSGKSYFLAQRDILRILGKRQENILLMHKVAASHRNTTFADLCNVIDTWNRKYFNNNLEKQFKINYSHGAERILCLRTGNEILFGGCKDDNELEKIKGIRATNGPITKIRCEEMTNFTKKDIYQLSVVRLRGETEQRKQFTGSMNPILATHFIKHDYIDNPAQGTLFFEHGNTDSKALINNPNMVILKTTHIDNKFYGEEERKELLKFKDIDKYFYDVYVLGNWGTLGNKVFNNYVIEDFEYDENDLESVFTGMDFGFTHAQAIERAGFKDGELYVFDELHEKGVVNSTFMEHAKEHFGDDVLRSIYITADSANPDKIKEWQDSGYRVEGAKKGPGSLRFGIEYLMSKKIHIHASKCPNLAREIQSFKRREDREGNATEDFVEINDDGIAALRYGSEYIWDNRNVTYEPIDYSADDLGL